jgi:hypothetical protein
LAKRPFASAQLACKACFQYSGEVHHVSSDMSSNASFSGDASGSSPGDEEQPYCWINEWLCEYVDGTMNPALEAVFTSYVEANPDLKAHIEELQHTRNLLNQCGLPNDAPATHRAQTNVCDRVESDLLCSKLSLQEALDQRPQFTAGLVASVVAALMIGVFVGATMVDTPAPSAVAAESEPVEQHAPNSRLSNRLSSDRLPMPTALPAPGAQSELSSTRFVAGMRTAAGAPEEWRAAPTLALDSLRLPPAPLGLMRTSR